MQKLRRLNFKHLRYFMTVAASGSVTAAAARLHVAPQTVSAQVLALEKAFGRPLFERIGKRMVVTHDGEAALEYAQAIFSMGEELSELLSGAAPARRQRLRIGITDSLPKMLAAKVLDPALHEGGSSIELSCSEGRIAELVSMLVEHELDAVLADMPPPPELNTSLRVRELGRPGISFVATPALLQAHKGKFPQRMNQMPLLSWRSESLMAVAIQQWLARNQIEMVVSGRFDDSALMKAFAQRGLGVIAVPTPVEREVCKQHGLQLLGRTEEIHHPVYLMAPRRLRGHPLVEQLWKSRSTLA